MAASNKQGEVIWRASYSAWGNAKVQSVATAANEPAFNLDLRLPGQWEDRATHLYYNYQRDYNPNSGRYLTPDPLGFPDGPDATLYVGGDPINKVDPLGLYQSDIHYYMTFFLATIAGLDQKTARLIALATQYIDNNPDTYPLDDTHWFTKVGSIFVNQPKLLSYHFVLSDSNGKTDPGSNNSSFSNPLSFQLDNLLQASQKAPTECARFQFLGEYLHAFEDTFSHRKQDNTPYNATTFGLGFGHGPDGSHPDYTYNHTVSFGLGKGDWNVNEDRTLEMEKEVFGILQGYGNPSKAKGFADIQATLELFNKTQGNEDSTAGKALMPKKIAILNNKLKDLGYVGYDLQWEGGKDSYNESKAAGNRISNLKNAAGKPLNPADYPGTILPK